ncbi:hypothetical protein CEXT_214321 [Caerostris extrusa]|uniref:Uncharacterized protein n=1 Tax=Caerostris extrusa TaxID=172846 RepID=A0AAV4N8L9_CAEEX|nr:hypothetical protein CEXT_214321 [Caerostris extrusa]
MEALLQINLGLWLSSFFPIDSRPVPLFFLSAAVQKQICESRDVTPNAILMHLPLHPNAAVCFRRLRRRERFLLPRPPGTIRDELNTSPSSFSFSDAERFSD